MHLFGGRAGMYQSVQRLAAGCIMGFRFPAWAGNFLFAISSRPALCLIQPPTQRLQEPLFPQVERPSVKLDNFDSYIYFYGK